MRNAARWSAWIALALLPVVFLLAGRHWQVVFLVGMTAVPLFLALAAFQWPAAQGLRWTVFALNLLVAVVAVPAFVYMLMQVSAPPSLWAALPIVAAAHVLALAPGLNVIALSRRHVPASPAMGGAGMQDEAPQA